MTDRRSLLGGLALAALPLAAARARAALPATVTLVVGAAPGGTTDALAREVAETMRERLSRNVVVENRAGAGGNVAASHVARASPDGGTLLVAFTSHTLNAAMMRQIPYRPVEDFTPVALIARLAASVLVVGPSVREPDLAAWVAALRREPGRASFAIGGVGSSLHMQTALLRSALSLTGPEAPFRGTAPAILDVTAGHVDAMVAPMDGVIALIRDGRLRALAVTSQERTAVLPEVPALREAVPGVRTAAAWFGVLGPAGMPEAATEALNAAVNAALSRPNVVERVRLGGGEVSAASPAEFRAFLERDLAAWREMGRMAGIEPE